MRNYDYGRYEGHNVHKWTHQIERQSKNLRKLVKEGDDLPEWINKKVVLATDYLTSAANYMANRAAVGVKGVKKIVGMNKKSQKRHSRKHSRSSSKRRHTRKMRK